MIGSVESERKIIVISAGRGMWVSKSDKNGISHPAGRCVDARTSRSSLCRAINSMPVGCTKMVLNQTTKTVKPQIDTNHSNIKRNRKIKGKKTPKSAELCKHERQVCCCGLLLSLHTRYCHNGRWFSCFCYCLLPLALLSTSNLFICN